MGIISVIGGIRPENTRLISNEHNKASALILKNTLKTINFKKIYELIITYDSPMCKLCINRTEDRNAATKYTELGLK